jgi:hypothetical protein
MVSGRLSAFICLFRGAARKENGGEIRCACGSVRAVLLLLLLPAAAFAQIQSGSIVVKTTDEQGAVIPGATLTVSSPALPADVSGVTDASGVFHVPGLPLGTYTVKVGLQGFKTIIREDIVVRQGQAANVDITMTVGTLAESVTVSGDTPVIDSKSVGSKVNIDTALLEKTPGGRDIWSVIEYKAPGVVVESPDVGGNQGGLQRSLSARGTPNGQNTQVLNGVNVNDPAAQGFAMWTLDFLLLLSQVCKRIVWKRFNRWSLIATPADLRLGQ